MKRNSAAAPTLSRSVISGRRASPIVLAGLFVLAVIALFYAGAATLPYWHRQTINFRRIGEWEREVAPRVAAFKESEGVEIRLGVYTGDGGQISATVVNADDAATSKAMAFMRTLEPPRPVFWSLRRPGGRVEIRRTR